MIRAAGFSRVSTGKAFPAASWRCIRAGVCDFCHHSHRAAGPRRFRVRARRRVRRRRSVPGAAARTTGAAHRAADRAPRRQIRPAAVARADAARTGLSQARTVSRHPARRGRRRHGARSGKPAGPAAAVFARRGRSRDRGVAGTPGGAGVCELRSRGRRGLDRAGASRRDRARRRAHAGRGEGAAAQCRRALPPRPRRFLLCRAQGRSLFGGSAAAAADRGHQHDVALGGDGDGSAAGGRRAVRDGGEHPRRSGFSRAHGRLGSHHAQRADDGMDRRHRAERPCAAGSSRRSICPISAAR